MHVRTTHMKCVVDIMNKFTKGTPYRPLFAVGDLVWLKVKRHPKGTTSKLQPKWQGPYEVLEAYENHTYLVDLHSRQSVENESRIKLRTILPELTRLPAWPGHLRRPARKTRTRKKLLRAALKFRTRNWNEK